MEYDTLREIYSSLMSALTRVEEDNVKFKEDEDRLVQIWIKDVKRRNLIDINYKKTAQKMKEAAMPWLDIDYE